MSDKPSPATVQAEAWCGKFEMPSSGCAHCRGITGESARPDPAGFGAWFDARLHGRCDGCDEPVRPGDRIRSDGAGGWLCQECGAR